MSSVLEFKNVCYKYPREKQEVLINVNLRILRNTFNIITGPTGSGKTTLLTLARGFHKEYGGEFRGDILIEGKNIKNLNIYEIGDKIGILFQNPSLQLHQLTVEDEVISPLMYKGISYQECRKKAKDLIEQLLGSNFNEKEPNELSMGEQQKTALAATLITDCGILLLDEPFSFLDFKSKKEIIEYLRTLQQGGKTIILVTHDFEEVFEYADRIILMNGGKVELDGSPRTVINGNRFKEISGISYVKKLTPDSIQEKLFAKILHCKERFPKDKVKMNNPILKVQNVSYHYNHAQVIKDISVDLYGGEIVGIIGPNGSGKTTFAKIVMGLLNPNRGKILLNGTDITSKKAWHRARFIGYVTQDPTEMLFENSVLAECSFGPKCLNLDQPEERANSLLRKMDLIKYKEKHPFSLSSGEKSKLAIADILVNEPIILLLDEPEFGLDHKSWLTISCSIKELKELGKTVVIITQNLKMALSLCDRIYLMTRGRILDDKKELGIDCLAKAGMI